SPDAQEWPARETRREIIGNVCSCCRSRRVPSWPPVDFISNQRNDKLGIRHASALRSEDFAFAGYVARYNAGHFMDLILRNARIRGHDKPVDIAVHNGLIAQIAANLAGRPRQ